MGLALPPAVSEQGGEGRDRGAFKVGVVSKRVLVDCSVVRERYRGETGREHPMSTSKRWSPKQQGWRGREHERS